MTAFEELPDRCVWTVRGRKLTATITRSRSGWWIVEDHWGVIAAASDERTGETDAQAWERMIAVARKITSRR